MINDSILTQLSTEQIILLSVMVVISALVLWVLYGTVKRNKVQDEIPSEVSKSVDRMIKKYGIKDTSFSSDLDPMPGKEIGTMIKDGVIIYSRRFNQSPAMIEKRASQYTKEEAWKILRSDFWDTKRKHLKRFQPEIYNQIIYWEKHPGEYHFYMNVKFVFGLPYKEQDFWVRRR